MPNEPCGEVYAQSLNLRPVVRLPDFLRQHRLPLPGVADLDEAYACLAQWTGGLICLHLHFAAGAYARKSGGGLGLVFLPLAVERHITAAWQRSPSHGHMLHCLAQELCRAAMALAVPEGKTAGCLPLPRLSRQEAALLRQCIAQYDPADEAEQAFPAGPFGTERVYSLLTHYPYAGGCAQCSLREGCPQIIHS